MSHSFKRIIGWLVGNRSKYHDRIVFGRFGYYVTDRVMLRPTLAQKIAAVSMLAAVIAAMLYPYISNAYQYLIKTLLSVALLVFLIAFLPAAYRDLRRSAKNDEMHRWNAKLGKKNKKSSH